MRCCLLVLSILVAEAAPAQDPAQGIPAPDESCHCRDTDGRAVAIGERACLRIGGRPFTATCRMARSQNNTIWRREREGCDPGPLSLRDGVLRDLRRAGLERTQRLEHGLHPGLVDAHVAIAEARPAED